MRQKQQIDSLEAYYIDGRQETIVTPRILIVMGIGILLAGCTTDAAVSQPVATLDVRTQADAIVHEARAELATLRSELAAARILLAKKEAEVQELRRQIVEFRKSEVNGRQESDAYQTEVIALKNEKDRLTQAYHALQTQLTDAPHKHHPAVERQGTENQIKTELDELKSSVAVLSAEINRVKQDLPHTISKSVAKQSNPFTPKPNQIFLNEHRRKTAPEPAGADTVVGEVSDHISVIRPVAAPIDPNRTITTTVRRGDSLSTLSKKYGITLEQLKAMNGLMNNSIMVGQALIVPELSTALDRK